MRNWNISVSNQDCKFYKRCEWLCCLYGFFKHFHQSPQPKPALPARHHWSAKGDVLRAKICPVDIRHRRVKEEASKLLGGTDWDLHCEWHQTAIHFGLQANRMFVTDFCQALTRNRILKLSVFLSLAYFFNTGWLKTGDCKAEKWKQGSHSASRWVKLLLCGSSCCISSELFPPSPIGYLIVFLKIKTLSFWTSPLSRMLIFNLSPFDPPCVTVTHTHSHKHTHARTHLPLLPFWFLLLYALNTDIYSFMNLANVAPEAVIIFYIFFIPSHDCHAVSQFNQGNWKPDCKRAGCPKWLSDAFK